MKITFIVLLDKYGGVYDFYDYLSRFVQDRH